MSEPRVQRVTFTNNATGKTTSVNIRRNRTEKETAAQIQRIMSYPQWRGNDARQRTIASAYGATEIGMSLQGRFGPEFVPKNLTLNRGRNKRTAL